VTWTKIGTISSGGENVGKKFIIELLDNCPSEFKGIIVFGLTPDGQISAKPIPVEDLTPYTEPDLEQVKADAYNDGYKAGREAERVRQPDLERVRLEAEQLGLVRAWEAARKIIHMPEGYMLNIFPECYSAVCTALQVILKYDASEAIEKIRQYEQEKRFCVGDEFENESGKRFVILKMDGTEIDRYIDKEGKTYCMIDKYEVMRKTGRHFPEIAAVLEKMRGEQDG